VREKEDPALVNQNAGKALQVQLARIPYLRGTGPNPFDYWLWADYTEAIIAQAFGTDSPEAIEFEAAVHEPGRTRDQRGVNENMTLGLHGEWGIWARLDRARLVLERMLQTQPQAG
jgi:hypothetical protein